jgi:hypothetical protein
MSNYCGVVGLDLTVDKKETFVKICEVRRTKLIHDRWAHRNRLKIIGECLGCKFGEAVEAGLRNARLPRNVHVNKNM